MSRSEPRALVKSAQDFVGREKRNKEVLTQAETYVRKAGNAVGKVRESAPSGAVITTPPKRSYEPEPGRSFLQNLVGEAEFLKSVNDVKSSEESKSARVFRIEFEGKAVSYSHSFGNLWADAGSKTWDYDAGRSHLSIVSNADFPTHHVSNDIAYLALVDVSEALSEFLIRGTDGEDSLARYQSVYNTILRKAAEDKSQLEG